MPPWSKLCAPRLRSSIEKGSKPSAMPSGGKEAIGLIVNAFGRFNAIAWMTFEPVGIFVFRMPWRVGWTVFGPPNMEKHDRHPPLKLNKVEKGDWTPVATSLH